MGWGLEECRELQNSINRRVFDLQSLKQGAGKPTPSEHSHRKWTQWDCRIDKSRINKMFIVMPNRGCQPRCKCMSNHGRCPVSSMPWDVQNTLRQWVTCVCRRPSCGRRSEKNGIIAELFDDDPLLKIKCATRILEKKFGINYDIGINLHPPPKVSTMMSKCIVTDKK